MLRFSRATDGGAIFRRVASNADVESVDANYSFWNPFSLQFPTRSKETRYQNDTYPTFLEQDTLSHFIGCFPGPFFVFNLRKLLPTWFAILWLFLSLVFAPINIYLSACRRYFVCFQDCEFECVFRDLYPRIRLFIVVFIRFVIPFCFLGFGVYDTPPPPKLTAIVMTICTKSPVSNMLFSSMNLRVMFSQHAVLHTVALTVALLWIPGFCQNCSSEPSLVHKFNEVPPCDRVLDNWECVPDGLQYWLGVFKGLIESIAWANKLPMLDDYCIGDHRLRLQYSHIHCVCYRNLFTVGVSPIKNLRRVSAVLKQV